MIVCPSKTLISYLIRTESLMGNFGNRFDPLRLHYLQANRLISLNLFSKVLDRISRVFLSWSVRRCHIPHTSRSINFWQHKNVIHGLASVVMCEHLFSRSSFSFSLSLLSFQSDDRNFFEEWLIFHWWSSLPTFHDLFRMTLLPAVSLFFFFSSISCSYI